MKEATKKRISDIKKKEKAMKKEIEFLSHENEQLKNQGSTLQRNVKQRQEISDMLSGKGNLQKAQEKRKAESKRKGMMNPKDFRNIPGWKKAM